jgi:hypothetical protein
MEFFSNQINASWATAIGTILLALVTFIIHILGDKYTRIIMKDHSFKFKNISYDFLKTSYCSWGTKIESPTQQSMTVEENILKFERRLLSKSIYLNYLNRQKAKKYILLAKKHAHSWDIKSKLTEKYQLKILKEIEKLAKQIGKITDFEEFKRSHSVKSKICCKFP